MENDNHIARAIEKGMGWDKEKPTPMDIAESKGYVCKFMEGPFSSTAWLGPEGVWSVCILSGIQATLLSKSFPELNSLYQKLRERAVLNLKHHDKWKKYYHDMWERRYKKWVCTKDEKCQCQLCRMSRSERK